MLGSTPAGPETTEAPHQGLGETPIDTRSVTRANATIIEIDGGTYTARIAGLPGSCVSASADPAGTTLTLRISRPPGGRPEDRFEVRFERTFDGVPAQKTPRGLLVHARCDLDAPTNFTHGGIIEIDSSAGPSSGGVPRRGFYRQSQVFHPFQHPDAGSVRVVFTPIRCKTADLPEHLRLTMSEMNVGERMASTLIPEWDDRDRAFIAEREADPPAQACLDRYREAQDRLLRQTAILGNQQLMDPVLIPIRDERDQPCMPFIVGNLNSYHWYASLPTLGPDLFGRFSHPGLFPVPLVDPGAHVIDAGAHAGFYTMIFANLVGPRGLVTAFEPFPQNSDLVRHNAALNGFEHVTVAGGGVGSSTRALNASNQRQRVAREATGPDALDVKLFALDDVIERRVGLLKLDVEGFEVEALKGAARVLREHRPKLYIEVHEPFYPEFGTSFEQLVDLLPDGYTYHQQIDAELVDARLGDKSSLRPLGTMGLIVGVPNEALGPSG